MAAGNNGASTPEDDDPFGYLYADGQAAGAQAPRQGGGYGYPGPASPGVPRTSYNQVRAVGERQYGQVPPQQQYQQYQQYAQPSPQYAAPESYPGGGDRTRPVPQAQPPQRGGGRGGGPNTKGLLIGAIAVVGVVVAGITIAVLTNTSDGTKDDQANPAPAASQVQESPSARPSASQEEQPVELPKQDAATLQLGGPATLGKDVKGAKGADGAYVMFNGVGGSASWTVEVPKDGEYTLFLTYGVPGRDAKTSLSINGEQPRGINMSNFAQAAENDWEKGWTKTYSWVTLKKGVNTMKMSCEPGDQCEAYLDQVWLKQGHVKG